MLSLSLGLGLSKTLPQSGSSFFGVLDGLSATSAYAWSSSRRLTVNYTGSLVRVRRDSDDALQDIGYDANGDLDTASLTSFLGAANGFLHTIYDQSGSNNLTQTTTSAQPGFGARTQNGVIVPDYVSAGDYMANATISLTQQNTVFTVAKMDAVANVYFYDSAGASNRQYFRCQASDHRISAGTELDSADNAVNTDAHVFITDFNGATSNIYRDGGGYVITGNAGTGSMTGITVGAFYGLSSWFDGTIPEIIAFDSAVSDADKNTIGNNCQSYYATTAWTNI